MSKGLLLLILMFFFGIYTESRAESRSEIDQAKLIHEGKLPRKQENLKVAYPALGFSSKPTGSFDNSQDSVAASLISAPEGYDNSVGLSIDCADQKIPIKIPYKYKNVEWNLKNARSFGVKGGEIQTDNYGKVILHFSSKGSVGGETLILQTEGKKIEIPLDRGPFEILLPMAFCKAK